MNRRSFLRALGLGAASATAAALDPDLLAWVPGAVQHFLAPVVGWARDPASGIARQFVRQHIVTTDGLPSRVDVLYGHSFETVDWITREALEVLGKNIERDAIFSMAREWNASAGSVGSVVNVRRPLRYATSEEVEAMNDVVLTDRETGVSIKPAIAFHPKAFEFVTAPFDLDDPYFCEEPTRG